MAKKERQGCHLNRSFKSKDGPRKENTMERITRNFKIGSLGRFVNVAFTISTTALICVGYFSAVGQLVTIA